MTDYTIPTNRDRAAWAAAALRAFRKCTGCDREDALGDLLCDLMHWAGQNDVDFAATLERARNHHWVEVLDEMFVPDPMNDPLLDGAAAQEAGQ